MANSVFIGGTVPPGQIDGQGNFTATGNFFVPITRGIGITSRFAMFSSGIDGLISFFNSGGSDFTGINFGGNAAINPSLRRVAGTSNLLARNGDNTADSEMHCSTVSTSAAAPFHKSRTTLTDGAGASLGTLANAPAAGNPTKWIAIDDNGTTRQIPCW